MRQLLPHIQIGLDEESRVLLVVGDYELFDFISDFLGDDYDLPHEYQSSALRPGGEIVTMYFPLAVAATEVEEKLLKLSPQEIERIYRLNN
jgi:hypothetical protein